MKKYKRIYIEITNICNLNCSFCSKDNRVLESISIDNFLTVLTKIDKFTDYVYLHVKGEPLIHKELDKILDLCSKFNKNVIITTNGVCLKENINNLNKDSVKKINISLHSENNKSNYLDDIFYAVDKLKEKNVVYRLWLDNNKNISDKSTEIVEKIKKYYKLETDIVEKIKRSNHFKIKDSIYIDKNCEFIWPSLDNNYYNEFGYCYALKDQIAILVDGTIVPCCLDSCGIMELGNIYKDDLNSVINSKLYQDILKGFQNRKVYHELCKKCNFKDLRLLTNK